MMIAMRGFSKLNWQKEGVPKIMEKITILIYLFIQLSLK